MCQDKVLKLLERENKWRSSKYISKKLGIGRSTIGFNLRKLCDQKYLIRVKVKRIGDEIINEYWYRTPEQVELIEVQNFRKIRT